MKLTRNITIFIHYFLDQFIPPILRDQKWFVYIPFKILFGKKAGLIFDFKKNFLKMSELEIQKYYKALSDIPILKRESDTNKKCIELIQKSIKGEKVLDIACGRGYLSNLLTENFKVIAVDFIIDEKMKKTYPNVKFKEAEITYLPFKNKEFDTTICAHTLEHIKDIQKALSELRRVTQKRLILVIPKQRAYKYTFDTHIHFFPYDFTLLQALGFHGKNQSLEIVGGDFFYIEDY